MPKIELTLPELPEGYEYTGEYRHAQKDELYLDGETVIKHVFSNYTRYRYPIVRKKPPAYTPPKDIFKPGWVTVDEDGTVCWYSDRPLYWPDTGSWENNVSSRIGTRVMLVTMCFSESILPPANIRGAKAIWEVKE